MKRLSTLLFSAICLLLPASLAHAQNAAPADPAAANAIAGAASTVVTPAPEGGPDFLEHMVDLILELFDVTGSGNTTIHYVVSAVFLVAAFLLRRVVTNIIFHFLKKAAARTETTLDDKLFPALESPVATFVMVTGIFAAFKVLKLPTADVYIAHGSTVAFSLVIFWGLLRAFDAVLTHLQELARERQMGVAAFMPWIKKTLVTIFVVFGVLMVVQSLGYDVKALLAGLGIGGLAFALAAQDTIANLFGSVVVAIDQPFKVGETVRIAGNVGTIEDIGLRSTKVRLLDRSLMIIPNKTVAAEAVTNLARFTERRTEQVLGLTYDTTPEQMEGIVADLRALLRAAPEIDPDSVLVYFRDYGPSSLDIWIVYMVRDSDAKKYFALREHFNLAFMRAVQARGLSFAFPTQTVHLDGPVAKKLAERGGDRRE